MSSGNDWERLLKVAISVGKSILDGKRDPGAVADVLQGIVNERADGANSLQLLATIDLVVPSDYVHATQLTTFRKEHESEFEYFNPDITDDHFPNPSVILTPGQKLQVKIFHLTQRMSSEDLLAFLRKQKALLVGAQGTSLAYQMAKDKLPKGYGYASFDEKDRLWRDSDGDHRVPCVFAFLDGNFSFLFGFFECDWRDDNCLLCFCDLPADLSAEALA